MNDFEYINESEDPSIGFPFNVLDEFLDGEDEEEGVKELNLRKILRTVKYWETAG